MTTLAASSDRLAIATADPMDDRLGRGRLLPILAAKWALAALRLGGVWRFQQTEMDEWIAEERDEVADDNSQFDRCTTSTEHGAV